MAFDYDSFSGIVTNPSGIGYALPYCNLAQNYPLVQSADLTDTFIDDYTADEPTNVIVAVADLVNITGNQIFSKQDEGNLIKLLIYDKAMTDAEVTTIAIFMGLAED